MCKGSIPCAAEVATLSHTINKATASYNFVSFRDSSNLRSPMIHCTPDVLSTIHMVAAGRYTMSGGIEKESEY